MTEKSGATAPEELSCDLLALGGGPGGYSAAFRAADLGLKVVIVDERPTLGGVCLNVGCIPSKTYLHQAALIGEALRAGKGGVAFAPPTVDLAAMRRHKNEVVGKLTGGLGGLAKTRGVRILRGTGRFESADTLAVQTDTAPAAVVRFKYCVIAAGGAPTRLPQIPDDPRVVDSTGALELPTVPRNMLVVGGGVIGLEMATVYAALGARVDVAEFSDGLMPGADRDAVAVWEKVNAPSLGRIMLKTKVAAVDAKNDGLWVRFDGAAAPVEPQRYDLMLQSVGRTPNSGGLALDRAGIKADAQGFIPVDSQMRTNTPRIFAIGDIVGPPMLAHKATHEGHVAAEVAAGELLGDREMARCAMEARVIPAVAYTQPEIAWVGVTETQAKAEGRAIEIAKFPWTASGRALANGCDVGFAKLVLAPSDRRVLGGAVVGPGAGDMIGEIALAVEMGANAEDVALTIHPHPTLGETIGLAAEAALGTCADLPPKRKK